MAKPQEHTRPYLCLYNNQRKNPVDPSFLVPFHFCPMTSPCWNGFCTIPQPPFYRFCGQSGHACMVGKTMAFGTGCNGQTRYFAAVEACSPHIFPLADPIYSGPDIFHPSLVDPWGFPPSNYSCTDSNQQSHLDGEYHNSRVASPGPSSHHKKDQPQSHPSPILRGSRPCE